MITKKRGKRLPTWLIIGAIVLFLFMITTTIDYYYYRDRIYAGIYLEDINLGKLTSSEASALLEGKLSGNKFSENLVELNYEGIQVQKTFDELGISANVEQMLNEALQTGKEGLHLFRYLKRLRLSRQHYWIVPAITIDQTRFEESLQDIIATVEREPVNADLKLSADRKTVSIEKDIPGRKLDLAATREELQQALTSFFSPVTSTFIVAPIQADITASYLESLQVKEVVSTYTTEFSHGIPNRVHNIRLAAAALDKIFILPGDEFSFNNIVGDSTAERGYKTAPIIVRGKLVDGIGGGVCQVSTTLYNTVLLANLDIVERRNHSLYVNYVPPGLDATVAYGNIDFRFKNTHPHPLWLRTFIDGNKLTITLYSTKIPGQEVTVYTTNVVTIPAGEKLTETGKLPKGTKELVATGKPGYKATVWRMIKINGEETKEQISKDTYKPTPAEYLIGTAEIPVSEENDKPPENDEETE